MILVGWSLGGLIAREVAKVRPDLVAKVVTMGSAVVDTFCLDLGSADGPERRAAIEAAILAVVPRPAPKKPDAGMPGPEIIGS